jgi:hypothetical protein
MRKLLCILVLGFALPAVAEQTVLQPLPEVGPPPTGINTEDDLQPEVSIIKRDDAVVHEYRMNGELYMVRVEPVRGYPYYLIDSDGDGSLDSRYREMDPGLVVPSWMINRW